MKTEKYILNIASFIIDGIESERFFSEYINLLKYILIKNLDQEFLFPIFLDLQTEVENLWDLKRGFVF